MSRPKGFPKTGGRVRGTPNKATDALVRKLMKLGCDPIEGLAKIALDPATEVSLKVRCFAELAQYIYPKRKAVDQSPENSELKVTVETIGPSISLGDLFIPMEHPTPSRIVKDPARSFLPLR
jgi:hypothetical protein